MWHNREKITDFALDTNIIIHLFDIHQNKEINFVKKSARFSESVYHLYDLINSDDCKFNFYITPEVQSEILKGVEEYGHDPEIVNFINKSNISPLVPNGAEIQKADFLQRVYTGQVKKYKKFPTIFSKENASDARILAESTALGCMLLTNNTIHFIGKQPSDREIKNRIILINSYLDEDYGIPYTTLSFFKTFAHQYYDHSADNFKEAPECLLENLEEESDADDFSDYKAMQKSLMEGIRERMRHERSSNPDDFEDVPPSTNDNPTN